MDPIPVALVVGCLIFFLVWFFPKIWAPWTLPESFISIGTIWLLTGFPVLYYLSSIYAGIEGQWSFWLLGLFFLTIGLGGKLTGEVREKPVYRFVIVIILTSTAAIYASALMDETHDNLSTPGEAFGPTLFILGIPILLGLGMLAYLLLLPKIRTYNLGKFFGKTWILSTILLFNTILVGSCFYGFYLQFIGAFEPWDTVFIDLWFGSSTGVVAWVSVLFLEGFLFTSNYEAQPSYKSENKFPPAAPSR
jgi:hypothetical protein